MEKMEFGMPQNCLGCSTKINPDQRQCNFDGHIFDETFAVVTNKRDINCPYDNSIDLDLNFPMTRVVAQMIKYAVSSSDFIMTTTSNEQYKVNVTITKMYGNDEK